MGLDGLKVLAVIPARGGSKGIPRKNLSSVAGRPLIAYTILAARKSRLIDRLVVSTDDPEIAEISRDYGAEVPFLRPAPLAEDRTPTVPVIQHAVKSLEDGEGFRPDVVVVLQPTAPLRMAEDIDGAVRKLVETGADSVISVCDVGGFHPARVKKIVDDRLLPFCVEEAEGTMRQDLPPAYIRNGAIYVARRDLLMLRNTLWGEESRPYVMPVERSLNVESQIDLRVAEEVLKQQEAVYVEEPYEGEVQFVDMVWGSWYGNEELRLALPREWSLQTAMLRDAPAISDREIEEAILNPIGSPRLQDIARGKRSVAIAVDDLTRPTETYRILPIVLRELEAAGLKDEQAYLVVSLGTHRPLSRGDMVKKIGVEMVKRLKYYNHNPYENLVSIGRTSWGTPLLINRFFMEAELRMTISSLNPHPYAGFGGGAKLILPGLAGIDAIEVNHRPVHKGLSGMIGMVEGNTRRGEIDEAGRLAGVGFTVDTVCNSKGRTAGVFAGEPSESFRRAVSFAQRIYATDVPYNLDIGIFNAFPKDSNLLQALNALNVWGSRSRERQIVREGGCIVIVTVCPEGAGYHGLADKGMRMYVKRDQHGTFKEILAGRRLIFFSPNLIPQDIYDLYSERTLLFNRWRDLLAELKRAYPGSVTVGVFPCGPLQIDSSILTAS